MPVGRFDASPQLRLNIWRLALLGSIERDELKFNPAAGLPHHQLFVVALYSTHFS